MTTMRRRIPLMFPWMLKELNKKFTTNGTDVLVDGVPALTGLPGPIKSLGVRHVQGVGSVRAYWRLGDGRVITTNLEGFDPQEVVVDVWRAPLI